MKNFGGPKGQGWGYLSEKRTSALKRQLFRVDNGSTEVVPFPFALFAKSAGTDSSAEAELPPEEVFYCLLEESGLIDEGHVAGFWQDHQL